MTQIWIRALCLGVAIAIGAVGSVATGQTEPAGPSESNKALLRSQLGIGDAGSATPEMRSRRFRVDWMLRAIGETLEACEAEAIRPVGRSESGLDAPDTQLTWRTRWVVRFTRAAVLEHQRDAGVGGDGRSLLQSWFDDTAAQLLDATRRAYEAEALLDEWREEVDFGVEFIERIRPDQIELDCNGDPIDLDRFEERSAATYRGGQLVRAFDPVAGREPVDAPAQLAPTRQVRVEIIPDRASWHEAEMIRGVVRITNTGDKLALVRRSEMTTLTVRRLDGAAVFKHAPAQEPREASYFGDALTILPGATIEERFGVLTDPHSGSVAERMSPGRWLLAPGRPAAESKVEVVGDPIEIEMLPIDEEIGRRILAWEIGGGDLGILREGGEIERVDLATGRVAWSGRIALPEAFSRGSYTLIRRSDGVSLAVLDRQDEDDDFKLALHPIGSGPFLGQLTIPSIVHHAFLMPNSGLGSVWCRYFEEDSSGVMWMNAENGTTGCIALELGGNLVVAPQGDYVIPKKPFNGREGLVELQACSLHTGAGSGGRVVLPFELVALDGASQIQTMSAMWMMNDSWFAGRDGIYRTTATGVRWGSYEGDSAKAWGDAPSIVVAESDDGRYVAMRLLTVGPRVDAAPLNQVEVWDTQLQKRILVIDDGQSRSVRFASEPARLIAVIEKGMPPRLWHAEEFEVYNLDSGRLGQLVRVGGPK